MADKNNSPAESRSELALLRLLADLVKGNCDPETIRVHDSLKGWNAILMLWPEGEPVPSLCEARKHNVSLNDCSLDILDFFQKLPDGTRMTTDRLWSEMMNQKIHHGHSTVKRALSDLKKLGRLDNKGDHKGYFLAPVALQSDPSSDPDQPDDEPTETEPC